MTERIVLLGPPASGKGTQAELLADHLGLPIGSTGQMLRDEERRRSEIGLLSIELSKTGTLVPDPIIMELVAHWMAENGARFLFDGFPRTVPQAVGLTEVLGGIGAPLHSVLHIDVDEAEARERVLGRMTCEDCGYGVHRRDVEPGGGCSECGGTLIRRRDDGDGVFELRMEQYQSKTVPVLEYYGQSGILHRVDGNGTREAVFDQIKELVE